MKYTVGDWFRDCVTQQIGSELTWSQMYQHYCDRCDDLKVDPVELPVFGQELCQALNGTKIRAQPSNGRMRFQDVCLGSGKPALQRDREMLRKYRRLRSLLSAWMGSKSHSAKQNAAERVHEFVVANSVSQQVLEMARADILYWWEADEPNEEAKELLQWMNAKKN